MAESDHYLCFSAMLKPWKANRLIPDVHGRVRCEPGWNLAPEWSAGLKDYDLWWVWSGEGRMRLRDQAVDLRSGVCFWMRPGGRYEGSQDEAHRLGVSYLHFHFEAERGPVPFEDDGLPEVFYPADPVGFDALFNRALQVLGQPDAADLSSSLIECLLLELAYAHERGRGPVNDPTTERIREQMMRWREQPGAIPPVNELAREAGLAVDHYTRCFARLNGLTPREWRIQTRLDRAQSLLVETRMGVSQVADLLGYSDVFHFSKQFKTRLGCSPLHFRRTQKPTPSPPPLGTAEGAKP